MIRSYHPNDMEVIAQIHEKHYAEEFSLPDFISNFLCSFTIVNKGEIVSVGGMRTIVESVVITDKDKSVRDRREALYQILEASIYITGKCGYNQIHASIINDESWKRHLTKVGFKPIKGNMLVLEV